MKKTLGHGSIVILAAMSSLLQFQQIAFSRPSTPKPELALLVYSYTDYSRYETDKIRERVAFIFTYAGIRINWLDCSARPEDRPAPGACGHPPGASELVIRLLDETSAPKSSFRLSSVGSSYASEAGGWYASVYCPTVRELARGNRAKEIEILGHAIAHEIGHLLLGVQAHTSTGIMKPQWNDKDLLLMVETNGLLFSEEQAKGLKMCLAARQNSAESDRAASNTVRR